MRRAVRRARPETGSDLIHACVMSRQPSLAPEAGSGTKERTEGKNDEGAPRPNWPPAASGGSGRGVMPQPLGSLPPEVSCAVHSACDLPGAQDARGQQGREGVGGLPRALLCTVHAEGIEEGRGQRDRRPEALQPGTRGRAR